MARDYTKIKAWQLADKLALLVYKATKEFPKSEIWGLRIMDKSSRRFENTTRANFLYRKVWGLKSEV